MAVRDKSVRWTLLKVSIPWAVFASLWVAVEEYGKRRLEADLTYAYLALTYPLEEEINTRVEQWQSAMEKESPIVGDSDLIDPEADAKLTSLYRQSAYYSKVCDDEILRELGPTFDRVEIEAVSHRGGSAGFVRPYLVTTIDGLGGKDRFDYECRLEDRNSSVQLKRR